ncbi:hypothetical protein KSP40_PGU002715 [Platanthera guangdongensis]|uniref:SMAX1-like nucleotide binding domain-containing protein n=1 Tax=Platanthera guangdongensis TaxID=2320717 RepID=A0ABR2M4D5_9ASPA
MGIATYQTYMKCQVGNPSLEIVWALQPLTVPAGSLGLSLNGDRHCGTRNLCRSNIINGVWPMLEDTAENQVTCSTYRPINVDKDAEGSTSSTLPSWLQQFKENNKRDARDEDCLGSHHRLHQNHISEMQFQFSSSPPSSSPISSYIHQDQHQNHHPWSPWRQNHARLSESIAGGFKTNSGALSSTVMDKERFYKFTEVNAENLKSLCNALERTVPWKKSIIPDIASTILQCRAGMMRRNKQDTWLFFHGGDLEAKEKISREIASIIFGLQSFYSVGALHSSSSSTKSDSGADDAVRKKRLRAEGNHGFLNRLAEAVRENPHRVFLVEDIEMEDLNFQMGIRGAMERGSFWGSGGVEIAVRDAIFILSCESFDSSSRVCSPEAKQRVERGEGREKEEKFHCLDLNVCAVDDETAEGWCGEEAEGILDAVDRVFFFKLPEDL